MKARGVATACRFESHALVCAALQINDRTSKDRAHFVAL